jgi:Nucleoside diphosphate kinase
MSEIEKTLIVIKPDAVRGSDSDVVSRFEDVGMKIMGMKMVRRGSAARGHYSEHVDKEFYDRLVEYMKQGPVVAMALEGVNAVENCRKIIGDTNPKDANPSTIRGRYGHMSFAHADGSDSTHQNLVHASATPEEAEKEVGIWFEDDELHDYRIGSEEHVR